MAKANINTATREELLEVGGLRSEIVDEIIKLRRKEKLTSVEALSQIAGVGPATLEQLGKALDFSDRPKAGNGDDRGEQRERGGAREPARQAIGAARANVEVGADATTGSLQAVQRATGAAAEVERAVAHRSTEEVAELGRTLVDLTVAQTRQNLEILQALSATIDWDRALELQSAYLQASLERAAALTQRYLELSRTVMIAAADTAQDQTKRAA